MSFSSDIRSSGNFQEIFGKERKRINRNEVSKDDLATLQRKVNNMRCQIDWSKLVHITDNLDTNPEGPNDFVFEPDLSEVMLYQPFANVYGNGIKLDKTLGGTAYDVIEIGDSSLIESTVSTGTYHYQPYATFRAATQLGYLSSGAVVGGDYLRIPHTASLSLSQFSLACWFRTSKDFTEDLAGYIIAKGSYATETAGNNMNYALLVSNDNGVGNENVLECTFETSAGVNRFALGATHGPVNDGLWHHGCGTYDGVTLRVYVDGVEAGTFTTSDTPDTTTRDLFIGNHDQFFTTWEGDVDEVYIWNNDLTAGEVSALYSAGTVPQTSAIVYQNNFGGTTNPTALKKCYYAVLDGNNDWDWNIGFHPPSMKNENSLALNINGTSQKQFLYYDEFGTDFDFTANNLSFGFWIYLVALPSGSNTFVMMRRIDSNNSIRLEIDEADNKLFGSYTVGGVSSKRQYDTALSINTWYYISGTCDFSGPTLSLKVNDNADTSSTKVIDSAPADDKLYFGGRGGGTQERFFRGYLAFPMWYKHSTVLTSGERTSLYNYNTKTSTTEPAIAGFAQAG